MAFKPLIQYQVMLLFKKKTFLLFQNQEDMIPELQALRENLNRTVDWICQDYFEQWSDKVYLGGHPITRTEVHA